MDFIQQVYRGKNDLWRYFLTIIIIMSPFILNGIAYLLMPELFEQAYENLENYKGNKNLLLIQLLIPSVILIGLLFLFVRFIHKRSILSLITSRKEINWRRVFFAFFLWLIISVLIIAIGIYLDNGQVVWNFKPGPFFVLLIISLTFIPIQTSFEELFFRGYLMQGLGFLLKNRLIPLLLTSVLFGLMHGLNPEVNKLGWGVMVFYVGTGLLFGITTLMDNGTELALGMHAANNIAAALFVTTSWGALQTDALFLDTSEPTIGIDILLPVFVLYPIILLIFSKKYGWHSWRQRLLGRVEATNFST